MTTQKRGAKPDSSPAEEFVPTEEQILRELKQKEQRKKYMQSDKAKEGRKTYMQKRYASAKAMREYLKAHPELVDEIKTKHGIS